MVQCKEEAFKQQLFIAKDKGFDVNLLLVQAHLETGHFRSPKCEYNNFFGIKPFPLWKGSVASGQPTTEVKDGKLIKITDKFIMCADVAEGIKTMVWLIETYHPKSWAARNSRMYFTYIFDWSTAREKYTTSLNTLYDEMAWGMYGGLLK